MLSIRNKAFFILIVAILVGCISANTFDKDSTPLEQFLSSPDSDEEQNNSDITDKYEDEKNFEKSFIDYLWSIMKQPDASKQLET